MSKDLIKNKSLSVAQNVGRAGLHALAPDDFEYYFCVLQLMNSRNEIEYIFNFPVMPNSISVSKKPLVNIKKTARGYVSTYSDSFSGDVLTINGTFGRKFRLLIFTDNTKEKEIEKGSFDAKIKKGYGALKLMEKIVYMSSQPDDYGYPRKLIFHNFAFNESFLVEPLSWDKQQSIENNMIWNYNLQMKALANANELSTLLPEDSSSNIKNLITVGAAQKSLNDVFDNLTIQGINDL